MGNQFKFFTIYTKPFSTKEENIMVKMMRVFENKVIPVINNKHLEPPHHEVMNNIKSVNELIN
jgi:hypothetical protein